jgi:malonyl-CoA O-methyltransferase
MTSSIDKEKVAASFHRHAVEYDCYVDVQKRVIEQFVALLPTGWQEARSVLDIGAGTGTLVARLRECAPNAIFTCSDLASGMLAVARERLAGCDSIDFVKADAEALPFADASFDLVVSTSTFQWLANLDKAFSEAWRVLRPGGVFAFTLFGHQTLYELRSSYRAALNDEGPTPQPDRSHSFFRDGDVLAALDRSSFLDCRVESNLEIEYHADVPSLLRAIKGAGAGTPAQAHAGLGSRRMINRLIATYQRQFATEAGIPATYQVTFGRGFKRAAD